MKDSKELSICVYTGIFGAYESQLYPPPPDTDESIIGEECCHIEYVCFADKTSISSGISNISKKWQIVDIGDDFGMRALEFCGNLDQIAQNMTVHEPIANSIAIRAFPKLLPFPKKDDDDDVDILIYVDANVVIGSFTVLQNMIRAGKDADASLVFSKHPNRNCIYSEMSESATYLKYHNNHWERQRTSYREQKVPGNAGMLWNGLCVFLSPFQRDLDDWGKRYFFESMNPLFVRDITQRFHAQGQVTLCKVFCDLGIMPTKCDRDEDNNNLVCFVPIISQGPGLKNGINQERHG